MAWKTMKKPAIATKLQKQLKLLSIEIVVPCKSTLLHSPQLPALVKLKQAMLVSSAAIWAGADAPA